jgi:carbamoyltransferase
MPAGAAILGISCDYHDAAAAVVVDGAIVAAAAEERFSRRKHDPRLPASAIEWCLGDAGVGPGELDAVVCYDKPLTTYERLLVTHARAGPRGVATLGDAVSVWTRSKLWLRARVERRLRDLGFGDVEVLFAEHHQSHAAAAFYPSPFDDAAILTADGVGEWATSSISHGRNRRIEPLEHQRFPDSLGLLYSTVTAHCGFAVNDGESKLMGLAPFGEPSFVDVMQSELVHLSDDGSVRLNHRYFSFVSRTGMGRRRINELLGGPPRPKDAPLAQREADLARSVQVVLEEAMLRAARHAHDLTGSANLCLAGGVALNCVANARIAEDGPFDAIWIQPAAGDDGGALGAALWAEHQLRDRPRRLAGGRDGMSGALLGPGYAHDEVVAWLTESGVEFEECATDADRDRLVAGAIADGSIVGWFQGRMEFGPRALGCRSILADARDASMVERLNARVKLREGFRPFAPAVLAERADDWFEVDGDLPYMILTAAVRPDRMLDTDAATGASDRFEDRLAMARSQIPACTHVDGSARVQTVDAATRPAFHSLLRTFDELTGCPVVLNTSFNGPDEPIVRTPADALRCATRIGLDLLVLERCVIRPTVAVAP